MSEEGRPDGPNACRPGSAGKPPAWQGRGRRAPSARRQAGSGWGPLWWGCLCPPWAAGFRFASSRWQALPLRISCKANTAIHLQARVIRYHLCQSKLKMCKENSNLPFITLLDIWASVAVYSIQPTTPRPANSDSACKSTAGHNDILRCPAHSRLREGMPDTN